MKVMIAICMQQQCGSLTCTRCGDDEDGLGLVVTTAASSVCGMNYGA